MVEKPADLDILNSYNEPLFRGYIDSADAAACIFKALRVARIGRYALPQVLTAGTHNRFRCDWIQEFGQGSLIAIRCEEVAHGPSLVVY